MTQSNNNLEQPLPRCVTEGFCRGEIKHGQVAIGFCAAYSWSKHGTEEQKKKIGELLDVNGYDCPVGGYPYSQEFY